ncbi:hypothetical protein NX059_010438 [Plenodomus lindquistii]|nr:hypothetical protein NX059_010438 [Plenodomus lindquistii]
MFNLFTRGYKRLFGFCDTNSNTANETPSTFAEHAQSARVAVDHLKAHLERGRAPSAKPVVSKKPRSSFAQPTARDAHRNAHAQGFFVASVSKALPRKSRYIQKRLAVSSATAKRESPRSTTKGPRRPNEQRNATTPRHNAVQKSSVAPSSKVLISTSTPIHERLDLAGRMTHDKKVRFQLLSPANNETNNRGRGHGTRKSKDKGRNTSETTDTGDVKASVSQHISKARQPKVTNDVERSEHTTNSTTAVSQQASRAQQPTVTGIQTSESAAKATLCSISQPQQHEGTCHNINEERAMVASTHTIGDSTAEGPFPNDYVGSFNSMLPFQPSHTSTNGCGHFYDMNLHKLACGHWIKSPWRCGRTCHNANLDVEAFICQQCQKAATQVLESKLTAEQDVALGLFLNGPVDDLVSYLSTLLTLHLGNIGGVDDLARTFATKNVYGRLCNAVLLHDPEVKYAQHILDRERLVEEMTAAKEKKDSSVNKETTQHDIVDVAGCMRNVCRSYTVLNDQCRPIAVPHTRNHPAFYIVNSVSGVKRKTPVDFEESGAKHLKVAAKEAKQVEPDLEKLNVPYMEWYGGIAVWNMPNGSRRVIGRGPNRRAVSPYGHMVPA